MSNWSEEDMLEIFGQAYEVMTQKSFDAALKSGRHDFGVCLFEEVTLQGLRIADGSYDFSTCRFLDCRFADCYLDSVLFENTVFEGCNFENVEALKASFVDAQSYGTRFKKVTIHDLDAHGSQWRHGVMRNCLLGSVDMNVNLIDHFSFDRMRVGRCTGLNPAAITMGGATIAEVDRYRQKVLSAFAETKSMALLDDLADSKSRIYGEIYYISPERVEELVSLSNSETNDPETQEWRADLRWNERRLVERWDKAYADGMAQLLEQLRSHSGDKAQAESETARQAGIEEICQKAISRSTELNAANATQPPMPQPERG